MSAIVAFLRRDFDVARSYRLPFVIDAVSTLFVLASFRYLSKLVGGRGVPGSYFAFVTAGLALIAVLQSALTVIGGNLRTEQVSGTLEAMLATGTPTATLAAGMTAYPMASAIVRAAVYVVIAVVLGARFPGANVGLAVAAVVLASVSFAGIGLLAAAFVLAFRQALAIAGWVTSLLALMGGVYFPVKLLPSWSVGISKLSAFTRGLDIFRSALLSRAGWTASARPLAILLALAVAYTAVGIAGLALSLERAKRTGSLAQY
jgi:ABC-2 type transport system permease protein